MDFYAEQDNARRNTRLLVLAFLLAVVALILISNVLFAMLFYFTGVFGRPHAGDDTLQSFLAGFSWETFAFVSLGVVSTVFVVVLVKWIQLAAGGKVVAERLGGVRILPQTDDRNERRCLNVVEEMALAAGLPVPPVYLLAGERGINAFAAGISPADAVIGITRGSIENFNREQLQGVIAHEFSHILNGDMRLNIRLAALLKGITFVGDIGEVLVRGGRRQQRSYSKSKNMPAQLLLIGLALWVLGWLGGLFAGFIKAAISRQKEYLADASAVQFTRNPQGVANALKVIGGYVPGTFIVEARASELSHIFFGQIASSLWLVFATHPPLEQRIRRLEPGWNGEYIRSTRESRYVGTSADQVRREREQTAGKVAVAATIAAAVMGAEAGSAVRQAAADATFAELAAPVTEISDALREHAHDPFGATAIAYALLLGADSRVQSEQLAVLEKMAEKTGIRGLVATVNELAPQLKLLPAQFRLPLLEMSLPALKCMSLPQYQNFKRTLLALARADQSIDLYEWCMYQVIRHYLDPEFVQVQASRAEHRKAVHVRQEYRTVLSVLAWHGHADEEQRAAAFARGADAVGLHNIVLRPLSECGVTEFSKAVSKLANCYPLLKPRLLKGMAQCAAHNDKLTAVEVEILVSVAAVMDCPVPASVRQNA